MNKYDGNVYQAESGEWAWMIAEDGEDVVRGSGYETEAEAQADMESELARWTMDDDRKQN